MLQNAYSMWFVRGMDSQGEFSVFVWPLKDVDEEMHSWADHSFCGLQHNNVSLHYWGGREP